MNDKTKCFTCHVQGGFLNQGYLWCKWSRLLTLEIQTQILRPYLLMNMSHVSCLHDSKVFILCLCSCFELLVYFYMFYWVWTKSFKLEGNICLLKYNYLLLCTFHYYPLLYIPNVLGPFRLEPVVNPNQHTSNFKMHMSLFTFAVLKCRIFFALLYLPYIFSTWPFLEL